jgi:aminoglycoside 6'-N-acetyltransferase
MPRREYGFVPVTRADLPRLRRWLAEPHLGGWWGDPDSEIGLIVADLDSGAPIDMRLVVHLADGRPFGYVQDYPAHHWPAPQFAGLPDAARAMDSFLGDPACLGQGHAKGFLRQRAEDLRAAGADAVLVDPDPANIRAIAAYRGAGFVPLFTRPCEDGDPVLVMAFDGAPRLLGENTSGEARPARRGRSPRPGPKQG